jgi:hypothetical protein
VAAVVFFGGALDADQPRDADGKFGSGTAVKASTPSGKSVSGTYTGPSHKADHGMVRTKKGAVYSLHHDNIHAEDSAPDPTTLQGEAGRQARKFARDCMSGRFRP